MQVAAAVATEAAKETAKETAKGLAADAAKEVLKGAVRATRYQTGLFLDTLSLLRQLNQWSLVFLLFLAEFSMCTFLIAPFPIAWRTAAVQNLSNMWRTYPKARVVTKTLMGVVFVLFLDALRQMYLLHLIEVEPGLESVEMFGESNRSLLQAERNAFLCGCTLYMFFMLHRFHSMLDNIQQLEARLVTVDKSGVATEVHLQKGTLLGEKFEGREFRQRIPHETSAM